MTSLTPFSKAMASLDAAVKRAVCREFGVRTGATPFPKFVSKLDRLVDASVWPLAGMATRRTGFPKALRWPDDVVVHSGCPAGIRPEGPVLMPP